jgi:hypothetical protein
MTSTATTLVTLTSCLFLAGASTALAVESDPSGRPAAQLSEKNCNKVWKKAVGKSGDTLEQTQAERYIANFAQVDQDGNGQISKTEFKRGCDLGWVAEGHDKFKRPSKTNNDGDAS